jgi:hypothetical protein
MIHNHLPGEITTQAELRHWIKVHWRTPNEMHDRL